MNPDPDAHGLAHRPHGAPAVGAPPPHRSLVLAGGGMRVAWQAGVVQALLEEGLTFDHADGTSGGIFTLGMLLSGVSPQDMCERWRTLDLAGFTSLMPLREYLKGPTNLTAMGDADGIVGRVHPHLGIDVDRIRAATGMAGTFNVCDFGDKTCVAIPHTDIDTELMVAGVSLPTFLPPVHHRGRTWTDAVWIKDANLTEAVDRGAQELWLAWCIGNTDRFGDGPLEQYVHTIEMSAAGALNAEMAWIDERNRRGDGPPVRLHVVKPAHPLPLDPDFFLGRITAPTLVAMGYRDARRYLDTASPAGVALGPDATRMTDPPLGVRWTEHLDGTLSVAAGTVGVDLDVGIEVVDLAAFRADPSVPVGMVGSLTHAEWGTVLLADGSFAVVDVAAEGGVGTELRYTARLRAAGRWLRLYGVKHLHDDPGFDAWQDVTTLRVELREAGDESGPGPGAGGGARAGAPAAGGALVGAGELRASLGDVRRTITSMEPTGAHDLLDRARVVGGVGRTVLGALWDRYA